MEDLTDARHQHQHTHQTVDHGGNARQQAHRGGDGGLQLRRGHFGQEHGGHIAHGHAQQDRARSTVNTGKDKGQDAELRLRRVGIPHGAKEELHKADLTDSGDAGDDKVDGDQQHAAHRHQTHQQKEAMDGVLHKSFCFHICTSADTGQGGTPRGDVACVRALPVNLRLPQRRPWR